MLKFIHIPIGYSLIVMLALLIIQWSAHAANPPRVHSLTAAEINFVVLSDIHFDPFMDCGTSTPCPLIETLRQHPATEWAAILAQKTKKFSNVGQDTNYLLLTSALAAAKQTAQQKQAQFVLILGDDIGHDYRQYYLHYSSDKKLRGYADFVRKSLTFMQIQTQQAFSNLDIYSVVGNNDSYQDDYVTVVKGKFFMDTGKLWSKSIKSTANRAALLADFNVAGYYALTIPTQKKLRLIVLNSNLFSYKAVGKNIDTAANNELTWLHKQLQTAQQQHQKVLIAMHIPEGIDVYATLRFKLFTLIELWKVDYSQRFQTELTQYADTVAGILAGHLHSDWFQIFTSGKTEVPIIGTPSISPIFGNNPGFKLFSYNPNAQHLKNYITYYYPLESKNGWDREYDFNHLYQREDCQDCSITSGIETVKQGGIWADYYKLFYKVGRYDPKLSTNWFPYYWCSIWEVDPTKYQKCTTISNGSH